MSRAKRYIVILICGMFMFFSGCKGSSTQLKIEPDGIFTEQIAFEGEFIYDQLNGYTFAASNNGYSLYFEEKGLTVLIKNNKTGKILTSSAAPDESASDAWKNFVNSGVVVDYYSGEATTVNKVNLYSGDATVKAYPIKNGFAAEVNFKKIGLSFTEAVTIDEYGLRVQIPNSLIKESNNNYSLAAIYVLPFLGNTYLGETAGYMFIPDGNGALIELKDNNEKYTQPYSVRIYGDNYSIKENNNAIKKYDNAIASMADAAGVAAPVFGMVHTDEQIGFLGIIESGNFNAEICAYPNGVITQYNWISARYLYREVYFHPTSQTGGINSIQKERETFDINVLYRFVSEENADYVGLAKSYRNYLLDKKIIGTNNDNYSIRTDFFAGDTEKSLFGTAFVAMTTVSDIEEMLDDMKSNGIDNITAIYKGWQKGGIFGKIIGKPSFQKSLGSFEGLKKLTEKYGKNVNLYLYADLLNTYEKSGTSDYVYRYNGKIFSTDTLLPIHKDKYRFTSVKAINLKNKLENSLNGSGVKLAIDGVTDECYSTMLNKNRLYSRKAFADNIISSAKTALNTYYSPNDYLWKSTVDYLNFRLYGSDYKFVSSEIPFFAIVLKGSIALHGEYVNFKADSTEYILKMIESGVYPSFLLTKKSPSKLIYTDSASVYSSEYSEYKEKIEEYNTVFEKLYDCTKGALIEQFEKENDVSVITYSNGTIVTVNFGKNDIETENGSIKAQSYSLKAGDGYEK